MPYRRPLEPPSPDVLVMKFESAIKSLVRKFRSHPYAFYTENDMHCYLYHRLYNGGLENGLYQTLDCYDTILLHKEYRTAARYKHENGLLIEDPEGYRRGAFDICVWDPRYIGQYEMRKEKVLCAAELALNECNSKNLHTINDANKLADPINEIKYGYLLFFVRDHPSCERNRVKIREQLEKASKKVRVAFATVNGSYKPQPEYLGAWGKI